MRLMLMDGWDYVTNIRASGAGGKIRIRNKAKLKPYELVDPRNTELRATLQKAEFAMMAGDDVVVADGDDDGQGGTGSASDSE